MARGRCFLRSAARPFLSPARMSGRPSKLTLAERPIDQAQMEGARVMSI